MSHFFKGKRIILCLSGSIAVYKSAFLLRNLVKCGAEVHVAMTANATKFVSPLLFSVLSGNKAACGMFDDTDMPMPHIELAKGSDLILVAPATANIIGKAACGIADDLVSTILLSSLNKTIIAPAMDFDMWKSDAVQANVNKLKTFGVNFVGPESGELASGLEGPGRLSEIETIVSSVSDYLSPPASFLKDKRVVVTAGPTREHLDPVRFISNRSTGKMGYAMAAAAKKYGAEVILISGPSDIAPPHGVKLVKVESALEMKEEVIKAANTASMLVMAAAVSDIRPVKVSRGKIKKEIGSVPRFDLEYTEDILMAVADLNRDDLCVVGFAAETDNIIENAKEKLKKKKLNYIVVNDISELGAGFASDTNKVILIDEKLNQTEFPMMPKKTLSDEIIKVIIDNIP